MGSSTWRSRNSTPSCRPECRQKCWDWSHDVGRKGTTIMDTSELLRMLQDLWNAISLLLRYPRLVSRSQSKLDVGAEWCHLTLTHNSNFFSIWMRRDTSALNPASKTPTAKTKTPRPKR